MLLQHPSTDMWLQQSKNSAALPISINSDAAERYEVRRQPQYVHVIVICAVTLKGRLQSST